MSEMEQRVVVTHNAFANLTQLYGGMIQDAMVTIVGLRAEVAALKSELEALKVAKTSNGHVPIEQSV